VKEGLIPKKQQHQAASGSSRTMQTGGSTSSLSFKRQATQPEGQLHDRKETQVFPKKEREREKRLSHKRNLCVRAH